MKFPNSSHRHEWWTPTDVHPDRNSDETAEEEGGCLERMFGEQKDSVRTWLQNCDRAFFLGDLQRIRNRYSKLRSIVPSWKHFFDVSLNSTDLVIKTMVDLGLGFNVQNKKDMVTLSSSKNLADGEPAGTVVDAEMMMFDCQGPKVASHLRYASKIRVTTISCGSVGEMVKIRKHFGSDDVSLLFRFDPSNPGEDETFWRGMFSSADQLGLRVAGLVLEREAAALGGNVFKEAEKRWTKALGAARFVFETGIDCGTIGMDVLDVGKIGNGNEGQDEQFCAFLDAAIRAQFESYPRRLRVICHPGEYLISSAFSLVVKIVGKRVKNPRVDGGGESPEEERKCSYVVNESIFESFNSLLYEENNFSAEVRPFMVSCEDDVGGFKGVTGCDIFGGSGNGKDVIAQDMDLEELEVGDWLEFPNAGGHAMNSSFGGLGGLFFPLSKFLEGCPEEDERFWIYCKCDDDGCSPFSTGTSTTMEEEALTKAYWTRLDEDRFSKAFALPDLDEKGLEDVFTNLGIQ